jgi:hypothetical protein
MIGNCLAGNLRALSTHSRQVNLRRRISQCDCRRICLASWVVTRSRGLSRYLQRRLATCRARIKLESLDSTELSSGRWVRRHEKFGGMNNCNGRQCK